MASFTPTLEASVVSLSLYLSYSRGLMQLSHISKEIITITASSHTKWKESMVCLVQVNGKKTRGVMEVNSWVLALSLLLGPTKTIKYLGMLLLSKAFMKESWGLLKDIQGGMHVPTRLYDIHVGILGYLKLSTGFWVVNWEPFFTIACPRGPWNILCCNF